MKVENFGPKRRTSWFTDKRDVEYFWGKWENMLSEAAILKHFKLLLWQKLQFLCLKVSKDKLSIANKMSMERLFPKAEVANFCAQKIYFFPKSAHNRPIVMDLF